jgi:hypothetical protein
VTPLGIVLKIYDEYIPNYFSRGEGWRYLEKEEGEKIKSSLAEGLNRREKVAFKKGYIDGSNLEIHPTGEE